METIATSRRVESGDFLILLRRSPVFEYADCGRSAPGPCSLRRVTASAGRLRRVRASLSRAITKGVEALAPNHRKVEALTPKHLSRAITKGVEALAPNHRKV